MTRHNSETPTGSSTNTKKTALVNGLILTHPGKSRVEKHKLTVFEDHLLSLVNSDENKEIEFDEIVDCSGCLIIPGLINSHTHSSMSLLRGLADDLPLEKWLHDYIFPTEAKFVSPDFVHIGAQLSMIEMLLSGTTTVADAYFFMEDSARAAMDVGIRAVIAQGIIDFGTPDCPNPVNWIDRVESFLENFPKSPLTTPALFCHSPYLCSKEMFEKSHKIAHQNNLRLFSHVSETESELNNSLNKHGVSPFVWLSNAGVLDRNFVAVHCVHINNDERKLISESGIQVAHCPRSNMKLSSGIAQIRRLLDEGINVGLGTDGPSSNNNLDLMEEMRSAALASKIFESGSQSLSAGHSLFMATQGGAKVLGMEDLIGSLEEGKLADVVVIRLDAPHLRPLYSAESALVYSARGSDVRDVFVNGRHVVSKGEIKTIDLQSVFANAEEFSDAISKNAGIQLLKEC